MIQFNLLPDIKLQYMKAKRTKNLVFVTSGLVAGAALTLMIVLFLGVSVFQKRHLTDLNKDIKSLSGKLQSTPDLNKILTVQNQIASLDAINNKKPLTSRFFTYINQITPNNVTVSSVSLDFTANTMSLQGNASDVPTINKYVDTLKFTLYKDQDTTESKNAFNSIVLGSYSAGTADAKSAKKATYSISLKFDPIIFDITKKISLSVPTDKITTRSETEKPNLFSDPTKAGQ